MGGGYYGSDSNIKVSNFQVNAAGTQITASVQILSATAAGTRVIRLETEYGDMMGPRFNTVFTVIP